MLEFTTKLNNLIWSVPMMFLILGAGSSSLWQPGPCSSGKSKTCSGS